MKKIKWQIYTRGVIPLHRCGGIVFEAARKFATKMSGIKFENVAMGTIGPKFLFAWNEEEINNLFEEIIRKCETPKGAKKHLQKIETFSKDAIAAAEKIRKINLKQRSNTEIISLYDLLVKKCYKANAFTLTDIDAFDIGSDEFFKAKLREEIENRNTAVREERLPLDIDDYEEKHKGGISEIEFLNAYHHIFAPLYLPFVTQEEKEIMKLALKYRDKKINSEQYKKDIGKIYEKFWWVKLGWENVIPRTKNYYDKSVKKYSKDKDLEKKLKEIENRITNLKQQREKLFKKYKISNKLNHWLYVIDKYNYLHDLRKELQVITIYSFYLLMAEAARRLKLNKDDLEWLWYDEVKSLLKGKKLDKSEIENRRKSIFILVEKKGIEFLSGEKALKRTKEEFNQKNNDKINEFKGLGVSKGKIIAKVKVCNGAEEALRKVKKGDILVCGMTLPDFVPAMKKAAAIITDEGGITCHAAIISREIGIPCVTGTKIATQVLKDGDLVEVDANEGIVKIFKK
ncbi:MAG: PEP-utilizing enzyme [bacterium]